MTYLTYLVNIYKIDERSKLEKRVAHYDLQSIKELIKDNQFFITGSARTCYTALGFTDEDALDIIHNLSNKDLFKSMTSYHDHSIWQDVYYKTVDTLKLYIKLQVNDKAIVISFKENKND